jgi:hypothetical protein
MRRLTGLLVALLAFWLALWSLASFAVPKLADRVLAYAIPRIQQAGITVDSLDYGSIRLSPSLTHASAAGVSAAFDLSPTDDIKLSSTFHAQEVSVRLANPVGMRGHLSIENFEVSFHEADRPRRLPFDRLTNAYLHIEELPLVSPRTAMLEILAGLEELFLENALVGNFEFSGDVVMRAQNVTLPARLYTERQDDHFRLRLSKADVRILVEAAEVDLSEEQIDIVSLYPVRLPSLIEITRQARSLSKESYPRDTWLRDALRHVSWSYLLTREFGPEFAKEVTDAQETKVGNTPDERSMDYHNNAVGRRLAGHGTLLTELPRLVRSHPDIIRHPREVGSRTELWR